MTAANENQAEGDLVLRTRRGAVLTLTLNRPGAGNSLSRAMIASLQKALDQAGEDERVNVVVIAAAGGKVFCAGHDLKEFLANNSPSFSKTVASECSRMMQTIVALPKPVIAKVEGVATAAGCQLVASCDLAVAAESARFATPGVNIGFWCSTPMVALSRAIAPKHAMQMLLTGKMIDAAAAARFGLINDVVPAAALDARTRELAEEIASKSQFTVGLGKNAFYRQLGLDLATAYEYASEVVVRNMSSEDAEEGISAFVQKRKPVWKNR